MSFIFNLIHLLRVLQKILNLGAEVNTWDVSGKTPLHYATTREKTNKTQLLMTRLVSLYYATSREKTNKTQLLMTKVSELALLHLQGENQQDPAPHDKG